MPGPLSGLKIIEIAGIGPGPFAGMMLADHGAEVIRVERLEGNQADFDSDILLRSRRVISVDLKTPEGVAVVRALARSADGLIEGFRPGVMERLGLGPDVLLADNPRLVYGRMTGWGQTGSYAAAPGHDINYIALSGALTAFGRAGEKPTPPLNMVGDFGGGGLMLAFGMVSALYHANRTSNGQVIDCAMTDGSAVLMSMIWSLYASGQWQAERGTNVLDTGAHYYETYETADGKFVSVGAIEPQFYAALVRVAGLAEDPLFANPTDPSTWAGAKARLAAVFATKTRDEWCELMEDQSICFAPVLTFDEAPAHPHNVERQTFIELDGVTQPAPAPRFSRTPADFPQKLERVAADILKDAGYDPAQVAELIACRAVG